MRRNILCRTMNRTHRRLVAWLGILGIAFAQFAVTAHACMIRATTAGMVAVAAPVVAHHGHCAGAQVEVPLAPQANACEVQCNEGVPSAAAPDLPPVALALLSVPVAPLAEPVATRECARSMLAANSTAPPLALRFCRLLI